MREIPWIVAVVITLAGCAHLHDKPFHPEKPKPRICHEIDVAEPVDPAEACPSWRRVALKTDPDRACPDPGAVNGERWEIAHLFETDPQVADRASAEQAAALPPALRPFCLYGHRNGSAALKELNAKLDRLIGTEFERIDNACAAVGPAQGNGPPAVPHPQDDLETYFLGQIGNVEPVTTLGASITDEDLPRVRLRFLDTQPGGTSTVKANSQHGYALSQIARKIACDEEVEEVPGRCTADIDYGLALPIEKFDREDPKGATFNWQHGGYSGSVDLLAAAVWDAVRHQSPEQHLVLNLSVAWDGEVFGGLENDVADMPVTVQALHRALEVASCRGALVVAAAGNRRGGPGDENGPLLPGGWERRDAPSAAACEEILAESPVPSRDAPREPLVYAAGGVRFDNLPLSNSRPGATPPRVAFASHAVVALPGGESMKPLTGTSVATAVISATASVVWYHWPTLTRAALMDLLYRAGTPLERTADFYHESSGTRPGVRRVALCPALKRACQELGGPCPSDCRPPSDTSMAQCWPRESCPRQITIDAGKISRKLQTIPFCGDRPILYDPDMGIPTDPCPAQQFFDATSWPWQESTLPQPEEDPCSDCGPGGGPSGRAACIPTAGTADSNSEDRSLWIKIEKGWNPNKNLSQAFLDVGDNSLALGVGELKGGSCVLVQNIDPELFDGNPFVTLRFRTKDHRVISVPLLF